MHLHRQLLRPAGLEPITFGFPFDSAILAIHQTGQQTRHCREFMNQYLMAIGAGLAGAKVLEKLLGPTAEYLGEGMRNLV